jgi:sialidase-1
MEGSKCYRIPTIVRSPSSGTLLAFAEQRLGGCGDNGNNNIVLRRSFDDGSTWGPIQVIAEGKNQALSNPNPAVVKQADGSYSILLHYDTMNNPSPSKCSVGGEYLCRNLQVWSHDEGATWSDVDSVEDITLFMPPDAGGCMPGPSIGIQATLNTQNNNNNNNSIYFSCHGMGNGSFLYWSEDFGKTWLYSDYLDGISNECSIAFLANESTVAMNCRTDATTLARAQMQFTGGGVLLNPPGVQYPEGLIDPNCQGSLISIPSSSATTTSGVDLYLSNDNTTTSRSHLTVKKSSDNGVTWDEGRLIYEGPTGYSQLVSWSTKTVTFLTTSSTSTSRVMGVLFELGESSYDESIGFASWVV